MKTNGSIYDWLEEVQKRPSMWIKDGINLSDLETMMFGYYTALRQHGIVETGTKFTLQDFTQWLHLKTGISGALGWSNILNEKYPDPEIAFVKFFECIEEFKTLET